MARLPLRATTAILTSFALVLVIKTSPASAQQDIFAAEQHGTPIRPGIALWVHVFHRPPEDRALLGLCGETNEQEEYALFAKAECKSSQ